MKSAIFLATGFEECEALIVVDLLRRAGLEIDMVSMNDRVVKSSHNVMIESDIAFKDADLESYDTLILPGGKEGTANLDANEALKEALMKHYEEGKLTCAICAAPSVFGHMGILKGKHATCFPSFKDQLDGAIYEEDKAVVDGNIITGKGMGATVEFAKAILLKTCGEEVWNQVASGIQY